MLKANSYRDLKKKFPEYIIFQKANTFCTIFDFSAIFFSQCLGYKLISDKGSKYKTTIPGRQIETAIELLKKSKYKYIITEHYEIIEQFDEGKSIPQINNKKQTNNRIKIKKLTSNSILQLTNKLKIYRKEQAEKKSIPLYYIFNNETADELVKYLPSNIKALEQIPTFSGYKIKKYGKDIIELINTFLNTEAEFTDVSDVRVKEYVYCKFSIIKKMPRNMTLD